MNGEVPMMAPVTGSRSGAPGGSVSSKMSAITPSRPRPRPAQSPRVRGRRDAAVRVRLVRALLTEGASAGS